MCRDRGGQGQGRQSRITGTKDLIIAGGTRPDDQAACTQCRGTPEVRPDRPHKSCLSSGRTAYPGSKVNTVFDDPNLVSVGCGSGPGAAAGRGGRSPRAGRYACVGGPLEPCGQDDQRGAEMLADADCIDDLGLLRHGGMGRAFDGVRAPSTLGTNLRSSPTVTSSSSTPSPPVSLTGLASQVPGVQAGGDDVAFIDVDDTTREVHGYTKQGARVRLLRGPWAQMPSSRRAPSAP